MKKLKTWFMYVYSKSIIIMFVILMLLFVILLSKDVYNKHKNNIKNNKKVTECTFINSIKTYEELIEENKELKLQLNLLTNIHKENESNTYVENQNNNGDNTDIKNIDIKNINPHSKSNLSIDELNKMLSKTGLAHQGEAFYIMERDYNVHALFAMGVAMHESANGYKKANTHNYFGFRGNKGWMSFSSAYDCIQYFGKLIHNNYSNKTTILAIQSIYCPSDSTWAQKVIQHMNQLKLNL